MRTTFFYYYALALLGFMVVFFGRLWLSDFLLIFVIVGGCWVFAAKTEDCAERLFNVLCKRIKRSIQKGDRS